jgi:hypothetical protein
MVCEIKYKDKEIVKGNGIKNGREAGKQGSGEVPAGTNENSPG